MPTYSYSCKKCPKCRRFELFRSMKDYKEEESCPICGELCKRHFSDFESVNGSVRLGDSDKGMTLGHLADRNNERLSLEEKRNLTKQHNSYLYEEPTQQEYEMGVKKRDFDKDWEGSEKKQQIKENMKKLKKNPKILKKVKQNNVKKREK